MPLLRSIEVPQSQAVGLCVGANFLAECNGRLYATDGMGKAIVAMAVAADGSLSEINRQDCSVRPQLLVMSIKNLCVISRSFRRGCL